MSNNTPKTYAGLYGMNEWDLPEIPQDYKPTNLLALCTCGCWITYGKDCQDEFHSDWCELKGKKEIKI